jgi:hypothetical protein
MAGAKEKAPSKAANGGLVEKAANGASQPSADWNGSTTQVLQKRLRNARKKLRGIEDIQAKVESGKELNADQVRVITV